MVVRKIVDISFKTGQVIGEEVIEVLPMTIEEYFQPLVDVIVNNENYQREILGNERR